MNGEGGKIFNSFLRSFVSEDDTHLLGCFFPVNSSGAKFSDFCSVWKCTLDILFANCADVFVILNDSRESFLLSDFFFLPTC